MSDIAATAEIIPHRISDEGHMLKKRFPLSKGIGRFAVSFIILASVMALPPIAAAGTVADCFKTVSG